MKILVIFIAMCFIALSLCQDESEFHCSAKPGCQIAQCDPVPFNRNKPRFNFANHLETKEFPITCKSKNTAKSERSGNLFPFVTRNTVDIEKIKTDLKKLEKSFQKNVKNLNAIGKETSGVGSSFTQKQSDKIAILEKKNAHQAAEIKDLNVKVRRQSRLISNLGKKDLERETGMSKLKKDFAEVQAKYTELTEDLEQEKQANAGMKKTISRIEQKLEAIEKSQLVKTVAPRIGSPPTKSTAQRIAGPPIKPTARRIGRPTTKPTAQRIARPTINPTARQIGRPTTKTLTTWKPTISPGNCKASMGNLCYFAVISHDWDVTYHKAAKICSERGGKVALIPHQNSYNVIMILLMFELRLQGSQLSLGEIYIWTGLRVDTMTGKVTPPFSYVKWYSVTPSIGPKNRDKTNVYLVVEPSYTNPDQGMENAAPTSEAHGVVCEIQMV